MKQAAWEYLVKQTDWLKGDDGTRILQYLFTYGMFRKERYICECDTPYKLKRADNGLYFYNNGSRRVCHTNGVPREPILMRAIIRVPWHSGRQWRIITIPSRLEENRHEWFVLLQYERTLAEVRSYLGIPF